MGKMSEVGFIEPDGVRIAYLRMNVSDVTLWIRGVGKLDLPEDVNVQGYFVDTSIWPPLLVMVAVSKEFDIVPVNCPVPYIDATVKINQPDDHKKHVRRLTETVENLRAKVEELEKEKLKMESTGYRYHHMMYGCETGCCGNVVVYPDGTVGDFDFHSPPSHDEEPNSVICGMNCCDDDTDLPRVECCKECP